LVGSSSSSRFDPRCSSFARWTRFRSPPDSVAAGAFRVQQVGLSAACLVGAIAESLVGPLSPPARAARAAGHPTLELAEVSQSLVTFCLRAVGAEEC